MVADRQVRLQAERKACHGSWFTHRWGVSGHVGAGPSRRTDLSGRIVLPFNAGVQRMNMKKLLSLSVACGLGLMLASGSALAQDHGHGHGHGNDRDRHGHYDHRYDHRGPGHRPGHAHYSNWRDRGRHEGWYKRGGYLPVEYRTRYVVTDWHRDHLRPPPRGYHWVRSDNGDFLLVAIATGAIIDLLLNQ
jgi:Ni/Co efflux regulator RcnB